MVAVIVKVVMGYLIVMAILLVAALANYLLRGFGLYKIGKRKGLDHAWMAFVPYFSLYFQGEVSGETKIFGKTIKNPGLVLLIIGMIYGVISGVIVNIFVSMIMFKMQVLFQGDMVSPEWMLQELFGNGMGLLFGGMFLFGIFSMIGSTIIVALRGIMNYQIYHSFTGNNEAVIHMILSMFIPFYEAICIFVFRNKEYRVEEVK